MSSKRDEIAERARRLQQRQHAADTPKSTPKKTAPKMVRTKKIRLNVDVQPNLHQGLSSLCREIETATGITRVGGQDVMRALLRIAMDDAQLRTKVRDDIAARD